MNLVFGSTTTNTLQSLSLGTWQLITANYLAGSSGGMNILTLYLEDTQVYTHSVSLTPGSGGPLSFDDSDLLIFGGAGMTIYNLRIFAPGSRFVRSKRRIFFLCLKS